MDTGKIHKTQLFEESSPETKANGAIDDHEFQGLLDACKADLSRYIRQKLPRRFSSFVSADDILQETWMAAVASFPDYHHTGRRGFFRWLQTIALRKLLNAVAALQSKKRGGERRILNLEQADSNWGNLFAMIAGPTRTPSSDEATAEALTAMKTAVKRLAPPRRTALELKYFEHCSVDEISSRMTISVHGVYRLLRSAKVDLQREMGHSNKYFSDVPRFG